MDKLQKVRAEVEALRKHYLDREEYDVGYNNALDDVEKIINSEEPASSVWKSPYRKQPDGTHRIIAIGHENECYVGFYTSINHRIIKQWAFLDDLLKL